MSMSNKDHVQVHLFSVFISFDLKCVDLLKAAFLEIEIFKRFTFKKYKVLV